MDEREALARCRVGDMGGLAPLVARYELAALRTAYLITRDRALAEDVTQEAFLHAFDHITQYDPARPFGPWFLRSVAHRALRAAQRGARLAPWAGPATLAADATPDPASGPLDRLIAAETGAEIRAALDHLPPEQRLAVVLRYYLDFSEAEVAAALACPPGTVKSRLFAARRRLRQALRAALGGESAAGPGIHVAPAPVAGFGKEVPHEPPLG
jgi:RNA polymerase sigma-70 factor (ECF subfamily)